MDLFKKKWFTEANELWPGQAFSLEVEEVLFDEKSEFQHVQVLQTSTWGKALILDGVIQLTEKDECSYQEGITHIPLFAHPNPKRVCIIGGGDGGAVTQVMLHPCVEEVVMCEIDKMVIEQSKKHFPKFRPGFEDPRLSLHCGDGAVFLKEHRNEFDVIICDSSDPVGPAESLFTESFLATMSGALREGGIACTQGECFWIHLDLICELTAGSRAHFANVDYASVTVPTYPCGQIGFMLYCKSGNARKPVATPTERFTPQNCDALQYYSPALHEASFVLPLFAQRRLDAAKDSA